MKKLISQKELMRLLSYDPHTGIFTWKARDGAGWWNTRYAGKKAGCVEGGYELISLHKVQYFSHRLAWLYVYGEEPAGLIDHISHVTTDNRIANLRVVDHAGNARNKRLSKFNTSGIPGVVFNAKRNRWLATIGDGGRRELKLGKFKTIEEAIAARKAAEICLGYHPNHGAPPPLRCRH